MNGEIPEWSTGIIYGNKVELNGEPSERLKARLDAGIFLFKEWKIDTLVVSWGIWVEWYNEAKIMESYLLDNKIDKSKIIVDSNWYTTKKSSDNLNSLISINTSIIWISQYYHISRVKLSLGQAWFTKVYWYAPKFFEVRDIYSVLREIPAYIKYIIN